MSVKRNIVAVGVGAGLLTNFAINSISAQTTTAPVNTAQINTAQTKPAAPALSSDEIAANAALAERIAQTAQSSLGEGARSIVPATLNQAAALLELSVQLNPSEPRFLRLLIEAYLQTGGVAGRDGAIAALERYRQLVPADQAQQIRLIDLYYARTDSADNQRKYLEQLLGTDALAAEIRAHIAVLSAKLYAERGQADRAQQALDQALKFSPLSPEALHLQYQQLQPDAPPPQRAAWMLQMLRSNPAQPGVMADLAEVCAQSGLVDPALTWYQSSFTISQHFGSGADPSDLNNYTAELVIADQLKQAGDYAGKMIEQVPSNVTAAICNLLVAKRGGDVDKLNAALELARKSVDLQLLAISAKLQNPSATQPAASQPAATQPDALDVSADLERLKSSGDASLTAAYAASLVNRAWLEIYFANKPADAKPSIDALRQLLTPDAPTLARLDGWSFLADGKRTKRK